MLLRVSGRILKCSVVHASNAFNCIKQGSTCRAKIVLFKFPGVFRLFALLSAPFSFSLSISLSQYLSFAALSGSLFMLFTTSIMFDI